MQPCDILIEAAWCLPVDPAGRLLEHHALVVSDGRIVDLLPVAAAREQFAPTVRIARPGHLLLPGLVNAHTHAAMTLFRGFGDDLPLERWLNERVWPAEQQIVGAGMVRDGTRHAIAEMLKNGITCFGDQYFFPETVAEAAVEAHMRAVVATPVVDFRTPWAADAEECLAKGAELVHDRYADQPLIGTAFAPPSTAAVSDASLRKLRVLADQLDSRIQIHLHETAQEIAGEAGRSGKRPFDRLDDLGMVNSSLVAVHAVHLDDGETARCAERGVSIVHCPRSNLKLASGIADVARFRRLGLAVGLGTDGAASNDELDVLGEMRAAALLAKGLTGDAAALSAADAVRLATLEGARALGIEADTGSLEAGKWADVTCVDLRTLNSQPVYDPVSQLVYTARAEQVTDVWVAGRHLVESGSLLELDTEEILGRSNEWRLRIAAASR